MFKNLKMVERQCHQKQNFQSLLSRNDFYGDRTFYHITAEYPFEDVRTSNKIDKIRESATIDTCFDIYFSAVI